MDNLTHSLIGAALAQCGLKRRTGLAMPAMILAANLPDIDAPCAIYGVESLSMRRGITHGPIALIALPLLLAGVLILFDRWQARRGKRPEGRLPVHPGWLIALCYLGTFTHPLFDWFNNYGIRLLEPFSSRWFYGDTLFIIDIWILIMLGTGIYRSRRAEKAGRSDWAAPVRLACGGVVAYVAANMAISHMAERQVMADAPYPVLAVANPIPIAFWERDVLWRTADGWYGAMRCTALRCVRYPRVMKRIGMDDPRISALAAKDPAARAFLFWSRMPVAEAGPKGILLKDQRFLNSPVRGTFSVLLKPD